MEMKWKILYSVLVAFALYKCDVDIDSSCPMATPCVCNVNRSMKIKISCRDKGLTGETIPEFNTTVARLMPVGKLDLRSNRIKTLSQSFQSSVIANSLLLDQNLLVAVPSNLKGIRSLSISDNHITRLVQNNLVNASYLQTLNLHGNKIRRIDVHAMVNLGLLKLNLADNSLHSLPPGVFQGLPYLDEIILDNNHLDHLSQWCSSNCVITKIHILNNLLTEIPPNVFQFYPRLEWLLLDNNQIKKLSNDSFTGLGNLLMLSIIKNQLTYIGDNYFAPLSSLIFLHLENNPIATISPQMLHTGNLLSFLYLDNTRLDGFPLELMKQLPLLTGLYYQGFPGEHLRNLSSLHLLVELGINEAKLTKIYQCELETLPMLKTLQLEGVPLQCDCDMAWLRDIAQAFQFSDQWTCNSPANLKGRKFMNVSLAEFKCANRAKNECARNLQTTTSELDLEWTTGTSSVTKPAEVMVTQAEQHQQVNHTLYHPVYMVHLGTTKITSTEIHLQWTTNVHPESIDHFTVYYKKASAEGLSYQLLQVRKSSECIVNNLHMGVHYNICVEVNMIGDVMIQGDVVTPRDVKDNVMTPSNKKQDVLAQCIQVRTSLFPVTVGTATTGSVIIICLTGALCWRMKWRRRAGGVQRDQSQLTSNPHILDLPPAYNNNAFAHGMEASGGEVTKTCPVGVSVDLAADRGEGHCRF